MEGALNAGTQTVFYGQGIWGLLMLAWFFCDGDKRDRTADLLNAMSLRRGHNGFICTKTHKIE